jgi:hypothetical protein
MSTRNSLISTSPASSSRVDHAAASTSHRSSDSVRTMPGAAFRRDRASQDRSMSMSAALGSVRTMIDRGCMKPQPGLKKQISRESLGDFVVRVI